MTSLSSENLGIRDLEQEYAVLLDRRDHRPQPLAVLLRELLAPGVAGSQQSAEENEVATVAPKAGVARVAESCRLADEGPDEVGPAYGSFAAGDRHRNGLAALKRLGPASGREGRTTSDSPAATCSLTDAVRQEHVDRCVASDPAMLARTVSRILRRHDVPYLRVRPDDR